MDCESDHEMCMPSTFLTENEKNRANSEDQQFMGVIDVTSAITDKAVDTLVMLLILEIYITLNL